MEPLDPKAELMRLADDYANARALAKETRLPEYVNFETIARESLSAAITKALADARRLALEEAAKVCEKRADDRSHEEGSVDPTTGAWEGPVFVNTMNEEDDDCAAAIRTLVDGKAGGT